MQRRYYLLPFMLFVLSACEEHQQQADRLLLASAESLTVSAAMKEQQFELVEAHIIEMAQTPGVSEIAIPVEAKIKRIMAFTSIANQQVKNLREQLNREHNANPERTTVTNDWARQAGDLYTQLAQFRDSVFNVYPPLRTEFGQDFLLFGNILDSILQSGEDISKLLQSVSYAAAFSFLGVVQFNVVTLGWKCATYCLESIAYHNSCNSGPNLIITQNPQVVLPGTSFTVGFGVGVFPYDNRYQMEVSIKNGPLQPLQNGIENIQMKAERTLGHYKVPLTIRYVDQDGKRQEVRKMIEYTVVDTICTAPVEKKSS